MNKTRILIIQIYKMCLIIILTMINDLIWFDSIIYWPITYNDTEK